MSIAQNIKALRMTANLTQSELAEKLGLYGAGNISQYESGYTIPSRDIIMKIADVFGVTANDILYDKEV